MNRAPSRILRVYLNDPQNRPAQKAAFKMFEQHIENVCWNKDIGISDTNLTLPVEDLDVLLMRLVILNDDLHHERGTAKSTLRAIRGTLNLIYQIIGLTRKEVML